MGSAEALTHRGLLTLSITALLYNWGFFTMLSYAPFPMGLSAIQLGFAFFGWGLLVAFFSVVGAPRLQRRFGTARWLYAALAGHPATEHGDPTDVAGEIADEFGGAGGAIDSIEEARYHATAIMDSEVRTHIRAVGEQHGP